MYKYSCGIDLRYLEAKSTVTPGGTQSSFISLPAKQNTRYKTKDVDVPSISVLFVEKREKIVLTPF